MPKFSKKSLEKLATCDERLQDICNEVIKHYNFTILCGTRGKAEQDAAVAGGFSKAPWPTSKHNATPSLAVDIAPYPIDWDDIDRFRKLAGYMQVAANKLRIPLIWGGTFTRLKDYPHFELLE